MAVDLQPIWQNKGKSDGRRGHGHEMGVGLLTPSSLNPKSVQPRLHEMMVTVLKKLKSRIR